MIIDRFVKRTGYFTAEEVHNLQSRVAHEDLCRDYDFDMAEGVDTISSNISPRSSGNAETLIAALVDLVGGKVVRHYTEQKLSQVLVHGERMVVTLRVGRGVSTFTSALISMVHDFMSPEQVAQVFEGADWIFGIEPPADNQVPVSFALPSTAGVNVVTRKFAQLPFSDIRCNYSSETLAQVDRLLPIMKEAASGVVIFNGPPGTGKSYLIRALLTELRGDKYPLLVTPPQHFLQNMGDLTSAIAEVADEYVGPALEDHESRKVPGTLVIMEDVGELLMSDNVSRHVNETANLLNMSDGLLALLADTVFLMTFNHDMDKINPALTRPGRCLGQLTVGPLGARQAGELSGLSLPAGEYTLAEVYEMRRTGQPVKSAARKLGFGV